MNLKDQLGRIIFLDHHYAHEDNVAVWLWKIPNENH